MQIMTLSQKGEGHQSLASHLERGCQVRRAPKQHVIGKDFTCSEAADTIARLSANGDFLVPLPVGTKADKGVARRRIQSECWREEESQKEPGGVIGSATTLVSFSSVTFTVGETFRFFSHFHRFSRGEFNWNTRCTLTAQRWRKGFKVRY